ncbi:MAG: FKBP-type peptidyl-prolyl cis-trans isomerase FklB [Gammaproteobacteria bacterium]|jgi:FKBP-type peptidyl-prolyl cis-trans isomerase FklB
MDKKNIFGKRCFAVLIFTLTSFSVFAATEIKTEHEKLSYSMGTYFAMGVAQQNMGLDVPAFLQSIEDVLNQSDPRISMEEMREIVSKYKEDITKQQEDQKAANQKIGDDFLAENKKKEGVIESKSGLQYKILKAGDGKRPTAESSVTIHYKGTLIDGTVFDSSYDRGEPAEISLAQVIKGWQEAVPMMKIGSKWQIYIPSQLAYGDRAASEDIGPNSTLIFDIELISFK